jgi:hypothetical protein
MLAGLISVGVMGFLVGAVFAWSDKKEIRERCPKQGRPFTR